MKKIIFLLLCGLIFSFAASSNVMAGDKSIADLESNPGRYENKTVKIKGIVRDSNGMNIPFIGIRGGCYKIDDGTGSIWVCSENGVPTRGAELKVKGKLQSGAVYKGRNYGLVIVEKSRKFRKR